jgi:cytochrome oxidase assembly protein ShyY1
MTGAIGLAAGTVGAAGATAAVVVAVIAATMGCSIALGHWQLL